MTASVSAARRWPHYDLEADEAPAGFICSRLLEDGDGAELRWLFASQGEAAVGGWLAHRASRALSARSRAYWSLVLGVPVAPAAARELWPLA